MLIDIRFCGACHSDIHQVRDEWGGSIYSMVPGHEIVGTVSRVGDSVTRWKTGDVVGVGCFVDSCRECAACALRHSLYTPGSRSARDFIRSLADTYVGRQSIGESRLDRRSPTVRRSRKRALR